MEYKDQEKLNELILGEIKLKNEPPKILALFAFKSDLIERILNETDAKITLVANDLEIENKDRVDRWAEKPENFLELISETQSKFDLILIINPEEYYNEGEETLESDHKELVRSAQFHLTEMGMLIFATHKKGFVLDGYIRPGADKLTKKVLTEDERKESPLQAFAFYK